MKTFLSQDYTYILNIVNNQYFYQILFKPSIWFISRLFCSWNILAADNRLDKPDFFNFSLSG